MMYRKRIFSNILSLLFTGLAGLLLVSCQAPRNNPFDPNAANYKPLPQPIITTVKVNNLYPPYQGIKGISVFAPDVNFYNITDVNGSIVWAHEPLDSVRLFARGASFFDGDSLYKNLNENSVVNLYLNAKPYLLDTRFTSRYENYSQFSFLRFRTRVVDPDGIADLKQVILRCPEYQFKDTLTLENAGTDIFTTKDFNIKEIDSSMTAGRVPELSFSLLVNNVNGDSLIFEPFSIIRIIEQPLVLLSPQENDVVNGPVTFKWEKVELDFSFTFTVFLYKLPNYDLTGIYDNIPADSTSLTIAPLTNGRYLWVLELKDLAGNASQSRLINFTSEN